MIKIKIIRNIEQFMKAVILKQFEIIKSYIRNNYLWKKYYGYSCLY